MGRLARAPDLAVEWIACRPWWQRIVLVPLFWIVMVLYICLLVCGPPIALGYLWQAITGHQGSNEDVMNDGVGDDGPVPR